MLVACRRVVRVEIIYRYLLYNMVGRTKESKVSNNKRKGRRRYVYTETVEAGEGMVHSHLVLTLDI